MLDGIIALALYLLALEVLLHMAVHGRGAVRALMPLVAERGATRAACDVAQPLLVRLKVTLYTELRERAVADGRLLAPCLCPGGLHGK